MRLTFPAILFCMIFIACNKNPKYTGAQLEQKLTTTLQQYLYNDKKTDSTKVKFDITDLNYFDDSLRNVYICEFKVHLHVVQNNFDTTGMMKANVSRDFKTVNRLF